MTENPTVTDPTGAKKKMKKKERKKLASKHRGN
jgi:hypothetical protein